jgi:hypothetical protein
MKNIRPVILDKYSDSTQFKKMSDHIYKRLEDNSIRIALTCDLEDEEDSQYPLEDLLDKFFVNCTDYFEENKKDRTLSFEVEGSLENIEDDYANILELSKLIGKHVYNKEVDGYLQLVIE